MSSRDVKTGRSYCPGFGAISSSGFQGTRWSRPEHSIPHTERNPTLFYPVSADLPLSQLVVHYAPLPGRTWRQVAEEEMNQLHSSL